MLAKGLHCACAREGVLVVLHVLGVRGGYRADRAESAGVWYE